MKFIKRWIIKLIADDIRNGSEIAKALNEKAVRNLRQGQYQDSYGKSRSITVT